MTDIILFACWHRPPIFRRHFSPPTMSLLEAPSTVLQLLHDSLPSDPPPKEDDPVTTYVSFLAQSLADANEWDAGVWQDVLSPYLAQQTNVASLIDEFRQKVAKELSSEDDAESFGSHEDGESEICNLRFNLAYGGKILLHQTKLRLLKGRCYALVGQNGVGKTTLLNAIKKGKIDDWPQHLKTAYVDSGSNGDLTYESLHVLQHLQDSTQKSKEQCVAQLQQLDFTEQMMEGTIGALSGGWQMKLRLVRAVLLEPDIYLLDEPTNHLSESAVKWITNFLQGLTDQTVLVVSHDTQFLENVCTDVIHYEQRAVWGPYRRLVHYKGRMSEFCELQPQAKHYFELTSTDDLKFDFPDPGRLEGVRTSTQKFLEMEHVEFRYPGSKQATLKDINLKMSLSSRVVVLG